MILKYMIMVGCDKDWTPGWEVISDIISFRYYRLNEKQKEIKMKEWGLNAIVMGLNKEGKRDESNKNFVFIQAWTNRKVDEPINILTNMSVFVMNNEGKTVESIR